MIDRLILEITKKETPLCAGLDTKLEFIPEGFLSPLGDAEPLTWAAENIRRYNRALIDAICDLVPCIKVQCACYEMYGPAGEAALYDTIHYAKAHNLLVIADAKRSDIGSSAQCYADAYIGRTFVGEKDLPVFDADFVTVNPYLGSDGIEPFVKCCAEFDKGIFVLVKTSNPSSAEIQDLKVEGGGCVYEKVMNRVDAWGSGLMGANGYSDVGAVVGATWPEQAVELHEKHPGIFFLLPGVGAQGASIDSLCGCFDEKGRGAIINTSRAMLLAWKKRDSDDGPASAREELLETKEEIRLCFSKHGIAYDREGIDFDA